MSQARTVKVSTQDRIGNFIRTNGLRAGILAACGMIAVVNIEPWAHTVAPILSSDDTLVLGLFYQIPFVGGILRGLGWAMGIAVSVLPWAIVQTFECLPSVMENSRRNLRNVIEGLKRNAAELRCNPEDDPRYQELVEKYNNLPTRTLNGFYVGRLIAYAIDAVVVFAYYPWLKDGWSSVRWGWPMLSDWDGKNILITLLILFAFQKLVELFLWTRNVREYLISEEPVK